MPVDYSSWLTTNQAAQALKTSIKSLQKFAKDGKLQTGKYQRPEDHVTERRYHPDDVERLRKERNPDAEPFVLPAESKASTSLQRTENSNPADTITAAFKRWLNTPSLDANAAIPLREKVFLTMPEAVQLSGLPDAVIRRLIHASTPGMTGARHIEAIMTGQGWRVRRKDLEAL